MGCEGWTRRRRRAIIYIVLRTCKCETKNVQILTIHTRKYNSEMLQFDIIRLEIVIEFRMRFGIFIN